MFAATFSLILVSTILIAILVEINTIEDDK